ncbi:MAG: hypothetical protein AAGE92_17525, partial [Cyanobacteria bacterium P01_G01_bin.4]
TSLLRVFDPMEMFGIIETLQHTVQQLEKERPDSSVSTAQNSGAKTPEKLANSHSHTHSDSTGDLRVVPPLSSEAKSTALAQIQAGLQDLLNTPTTSQEHQRTCIRKLLALTRQALTAGSPHTAEAPHDCSRESVQNS